ncbi:MAG: hypothetical protein CW338_00305 [Clostridiales bacterium]|nr:hypothetical protein [Clostridiales bacterium]
MKSSAKKVLSLTALILSLLLCACALCEEADEPLQFYEVLQYGDTGDAVLALQTRLKETGYYSGPLSGKYAEVTRSAVKKVQHVYGLEETGIADSDTQTIIYGPCYLPLAYGDSGECVKRLQNRLKELGYYSYNVTGSYYGHTRDSVKSFQKAWSLEVTGKADVDTLALLYSDIGAPQAVTPTPLPAGVTPAPVTAFPGTLAYGSEGKNVERVQQRLRELGYFTFYKNTSGYYKNTQAAVKEFQRLNGLKQTGSVDEMTWEILFNDPEANPASASTPRPSPKPTPTAYWFEVDVANQVTKVWKYDNETEKYDILDRAFLCATGTKTYPSPLGTFTLTGRRAKYCEFPTWGGGQARYWTRINAEIAFHSVLYSDASDDSTLKVNSLKGLGKRGSHGCIRLTVADAKWIYEHAKSGMQVWIHDDAPADPELIYAIQPGSYDSSRYAPRTTPAPTPYPVYDGTKIPEGEIKTLQVGSEGETVYWLQMKLKEMGYYTGTVTGQFREGTEKAVKAFQRANGLEVTGRANRSTLQCLYRIVEEANATPTPAPTATPSPVPTAAPTAVPTARPAPSPVPEG